MITILLALTAVTLISQRQRTVLLNRQIASLLSQTTLVLKHVGPVLDALPARSSTVTARARSAADLVAQARPLVAGLRAADLPQTLSATGQLLQSIDQPGVLANTVANLDRLASDANQARFVPGALQDLARLVQLQSRTLDVQVASLRTNRGTRSLTAQSLQTSRHTLAVELEILAIAKRTLAHVANIDRKTGPAIP